ncbi:uncharacterized protein LOC129790105 [Lutzomyia longipalpis]|uniref:uncharacterized protein LOC129789562 n=1 Tax=Lutzomyia longipalpis TaxID=7200 RepID=UPI0024840F7C|nr:uncharacterized protein LOC129789562 [Lutzomyia longipalpis]XP_055682404.1 uncharacterized protein LOC129789562 [Lutzomyia longipalpis]XP_055682405.1 uncharacterized protein LOC129789562 [Lutzomyia longipalpis]XP_055683316.1 uncharacterized protein LOC129790105 [Lutzomyia longipalpis]XP_055683317.1 uncharacterized protein LOC129790105 [Lutzomyia longipalpis]XP_055683318.1 uncharacterized protein LOC129790105 [Lutzomyia longipalpis]XP_055683319.1 uncharacterized protein LOC129790105 [Lutzom
MEQQLSALRVERGVLKRTITYIEKKVVDQPDLPASSATTLLANVQFTLDKFIKVQAHIETLASGQAETLIREQNEGDAFSGRCTELQLTLSEIAEKVKPNVQQGADHWSQALSSQTDLMRKMLELQSSSNSNGNGTRTKLPQLKLPAFDGKYTDWPQFRDAFQSAIHNNRDLMPNEKMQYLKMSLSGSAAEDISHIPISDDTYATTWERLTSRYEKKVHLVNSYIQQFMAQTQQKVDSASDLRSANLKYRQIIDGLRALGPECLSIDMWLIYMMKSNMNEKFRTKWEEGKSSDQLSTLDEFFEFMTKMTDVMERANQGTTGTTASTPKEQKPNSKPSKPGFKSHHTNSAQCPECNSTHLLHLCDKFKALALNEKRDRMSQFHLCFNCLRPNHSAKSCPSKSSCQKCGKRHHTLLHPPSTDPAPNGAAQPVQPKPAQQVPASQPSLPQASPQTPAPQALPAVQSTPISGITMHHSSIHKSLLPTALVNVKDVHGNYQVCRVLIDGGGECTMLSEECAQRLALPRSKAHIAVYGAGEVLVGHSKGLVHLEISSRYDPQNKINADAYVMNKVTSNLPSTNLSGSQWRHLQQLQLADPNYKVPGKIDIIIGVEYASYINLPQILKGDAGEPVAQLTIFGWTVSGCVQGTPTRLTSLHTHASECDLNETLQKFWESEEGCLVDKKALLTAEEALCEEHFAQTHTRDDTGRYIVEMLFKKDHAPLGNSSATALGRFKSLERRFEKDSTLRDQYIAFMDEYIEMNHMELVTDPKVLQDHESYYLPHQAVLRPSSETTKLRVVFNASEPTRPNNPSFNGILVTGPTIQDDLLVLLLRFRTYKIAFSADVEKMYRQILIAKKFRDFLQIFWRRDPRQPIRTYHLNTVTYGTSCAPYLAVRVLHQIAMDYKEQFPEACQAIISSFYMDDLLCGADSIEEAIKLQKDIQHVLSLGQFNLRKWASNSSEVLQEIPPEMRAITPEEVQLHSKSISALGLNWAPGEDYFSLLLEALPSVSTKRDLCAAAAKIFDPLGFIAPVSVKLKMMFQALWLTGSAWDDELPPEVAAAYKRIQDEFHLLPQLRIPRRIPSVMKSLVLHGFADASKRAFGAVVYAKGIDGVGNSVIEIVMAKSRVAPLKPITIPRLELKAARLLAELIAKIKSSCPHKEVQIHAWSDSTTVLQWLQEPPRSWDQFVARRVHEIQEVVPPIHWRYVPTSQNPADCVSRGILPSELVNHPLWWHGPPWLSEEEDKWPANKVIGKTDEERASRAIVLTTQVDETHLLHQLIQNTSGYLRIVRLVAYLMRFYRNIRAQLAKEEVCKGFLSVQEQHDATVCILKYIQQISFPDEYKCCVKGQEVSRTSKLRTLVPFLDKDGLMRAQGRLENSEFDYGTRHPIILPSNHKFVRDLVVFTHETNLHAGHAILANTLKAKYWIIGLRSLTKNVTRLCVRCTKARPRTETPFMGDLPKSRVEENLPFVRTGCDFAGPIKIRASKLRKAPIQKAYICVFICMSTKMMHLEAVSDLSTDAFLAALNRFGGRRGYCKTIYCDNGSNFIGASGTTRQERLGGIRTHQHKVTAKMSARGTEFKFIPAYSPTFGGLWERGVANVKTLLRRVIGESLLTFEELSTVLVQIEAILNSRPLCAKTSDINDLEALTPGHFYLFRAPNLPPEPNLLETNPNRLSRWLYCQRMVQHFWQRWHQEYLTSLQNRPKWNQKTRDLCVGDLVLIRDKELKPTFWKMGRVMRVDPGKDGTVRVVLVKTQDGEEKRAANTLAWLPLPTDHVDPVVEPQDGSRGAVCGNSL